MNPLLVGQVTAWIEAEPDDDDRAALQRLLDEGDEQELVKRFARPLRFGTSGLRGPVMAGPGGINRCTVRRATQGVVAWLDEIGVDPARGVVVGRDVRHGSALFNDEVVSVLLGAGVPVFEMPGPLPTPLVSFAVRALNAAAGIMITASHNSSRDNGFKLYGADGAQIISPHDKTVERLAASAGVPALASRSSELHFFVAGELLAQYRDHFVQRFGVVGGSDLAIAYTPMHGVGGALMMELFGAAGFTSVTPVAPQFQPDGSFPTLPFPNPEEPGALDLAITTANDHASVLVIANDPDADRLGVAVRCDTGWRVLRGDEVGWLLASVLLAQNVSPRDVVATTIVSSTMLQEMAAAANVRYAVSLTGFKWIARSAGEGVLKFAYEEALGYAVDPLVADKDGLSAALALCRLAHDMAQRGETLLDRLDQIESRFGVHAGEHISLRHDGPDGFSEIDRILERLCAAPPRELGGVRVIQSVDLATGWNGLPATRGVLMDLGTAGRVVVRPSGTEAKIKAYIEIRTPPDVDAPLDEQRRKSQEKVRAVRDDLAVLLSN